MYGWVVLPWTTPNECFKSMKQMKDSTKWNEVLHQMKERMNQIDNENKKNTRMRLRIMKAEWRMMNNEWQMMNDKRWMTNDEWWMTNDE